MSRPRARERRLQPDPVRLAPRSTKAGARSFAQAAAALGHEASELMLVDDDATNVAGARRSGWRAIHFESTAQLTKELLAAEVSS